MCIQTLKYTLGKNQLLIELITLQSIPYTFVQELLIFFETTTHVMVVTTAATTTTTKTARTVATGVKTSKLGSSVGGGSVLVATEM